MPAASAPTSQDVLPKVTLVWKLSLHLYYADAFSFTRLTYILLLEKETQRRWTDADVFSTYNSVTIVLQELLIRL